MLSFHRWTVNGQMNVIRRLNYLLILVLVSFFLYMSTDIKKISAKNGVPCYGVNVGGFFLFFGTERFKFSIKVIQNLDYLHSFKDMELQGESTKKRLTYHLVLLQDKPSKIRSWSMEFDVIINFHVAGHVVDS